MLQSSARSSSLYGTWTFDASRSSLSVTPPQTQIITVRSFGGDGFLVAEDTIYADGTRTMVQYAVQIDGREYPTNGSARILVQAAETVSLTRVDDTTVKWTYKKGPAVVQSAVGQVSPGGNTWIVTTSDDQRVVYTR